MSLQLLRVVIIISLLLIIAAKEEILGSAQQYKEVPLTNKMNITITVEKNIFYVYTQANETGTIAHTFKVYNGTKLEKENFNCGVVNNISNVSDDSFEEPEGYANENNIYTVTVDVTKGDYMVTKLELTNMEHNVTIQISAIMASTTFALLIIIIIMVSVLLVLIVIYWSITKCFSH